MIEETVESIARHYTSAMDSVNLINELKALPTLDTEQQDRLNRNQEHLKIMLTRTYWTTEDLTPFENAIL